MTGLTQRLGGILITPRDTLGQLLSGERGGFADFLLLLLVKTVALRLPQIARIGWHAIDTDALGAGLLLFSVLARAIMVPLIAAIGGGLLLRVVASGSAAAQRTTDVASICVVPVIVLQILFSLLAAPFPAIYQPWLRDAVRWGGGAWFAVLLIQAALLMRHAAPPSKEGRR